MSSKAKYHRNVGQEGLQHRQAINRFTNPVTQHFLLNSGLKPGMRVLDLGCGIGIMSAWLADQVGKEGSVTAIDNSEEQLLIAKQVASEQEIDNITFINAQASELASLKQEFDFIYCRFLLVHLEDPVAVLKAIYQSLSEGGVFACESAILGHEYCYPLSDAFNRWRQLNHDILAVTNRDPQTGKKLFHYLSDIGFSQLAARVYQPVLANIELRQELIINDILEQEALLHECDLIAEDEFHDLIDELNDYIEDESAFIAYTQSCQISAVKQS